MRKHVLRLAAIATAFAGYLFAALFVNQPDGSWHAVDAALLIATMGCVFGAGALWLNAR